VLGLGLAHVDVMNGHDLGSGMGLDFGDGLV